MCFIEQHSIINNDNYFVFRKHKIIENFNVVK